MILLFLTITLGFASVITLAQVTITSDISNARQTIKGITITELGLDSNPLIEMSATTGIYISGDLLANGWPSYDGRLLGLNGDDKIIKVWVADLWLWPIVPGWADDDRIINAPDIYTTYNTGKVGIGTSTPTGKLHIVNSGSTDVYIQEQAAGMAANLNLQNSLRTRALWWDSYPDIFYIGEAGQDILFSITPAGYVGIGTTGPLEKLEVRNGNVRISNLTNKIVLGTDTNGNIKGSTSGEVYNYISGYITGWTAGAAGANTEIQYNSGWVLWANNRFVWFWGKLWIGVSNPNNTIQVSGLINFPNGGNSTYIGKQAWYNTTDISPNTAIGTNALYTNTTWRRNTAIGMFALYNNTIWSTNTAVGDASLQYNTTWQHNTAIGGSAMNNNTNWSRNTAIWQQALQNNTIWNANVAIWNQSLAGNTIGNNNIGIWAYTLATNTIGNRNVAIWQSALNKNTAGLSNIAIGTNALSTNTIGTYNIALWEDSLQRNIDWYYNTAIWQGALQQNSDWDDNIALWLNTLNSNTHWVSNIAIWSRSLGVNENWSSNTSIGLEALSSNISGNYNTVIWNQAGYMTEWNGNIFIGYKAWYSETWNNRLHIGNWINTTLIYGEFDTYKIGIHTTAPTSTLDINGDLRIRDITEDSNLQYILAVDGFGKVYKINKANLSWSTSGSGDNLGNHIALENLKMKNYWIENLWAGIGLESCTATQSWSMKFENNCFQGCDGTYRVNLWWTCLWWPTIQCGNGNVENGEQCDLWSGNNGVGKACDISCQWNTPSCSFGFTPITWEVPLLVTFSWASQSRAIYTLNFGNWSSLSNLTGFSWQQYTYQTLGAFSPSVIAMNKFDMSKQALCSNGWATTITVHNDCGNANVESGEQCDLWSGNNGVGKACDISCQWGTLPACSFSMTPTTWYIPLNVKFLWASTDRVVYTLNFDNGYRINNQPTFSWAIATYTATGTYHPTLIAKNKYNLDLTTGCSIVWTASIEVITTPKYCGDGIVQTPNGSWAYEQCDLWSGNNGVGKACDISCQWNTPSCSFGFTPITWEVPLLVTFSWASQSRAIYTLNFGNWSSLSNLTGFSWQQYTYQTLGAFSPSVIAMNKFDMSKQALCSNGWATTITVHNDCGNANVESGEQCDLWSGNNGVGKACDISCQWGTLPACSFSMTPTTWYIPLNVKFLWASTDRVVYTLNFDNGYRINNQPTFSWAIATYTATGTYHPTLIAKNKYNLDLTTGCSIVWTASIEVITTPKYCGDGIVQTPNGSWAYEQCDLWLGVNSATWMCSLECTYNIPDCSISASPSIFIWTGWISTLTGTISPRANYIVRTTLPDGTQTTNTYSEFKLQTGFEITGEYTTGIYTITLLSDDWPWVSCSTTIHVYPEDYVCGERTHKNDFTSLDETNLWLCASGYVVTDFTGDTTTIKNVIGKTLTKAAVIFTSSEFESFFSYTYIDTWKNMVWYSWSEYIKHIRTLWGMNITILLPEQWYKYWTRTCADKDLLPISKCYAHKKLNWTCAYDMNLDDTLSARNITTGQLADAMANSGKLFKCSLFEPFIDDESNFVNYKFTRWLPGQNIRWQATCEVVPWGSTEQNLYYLHRTCPWYNYGEPSQSCDSVLQTWQWLASCAELLTGFYWMIWNTWGLTRR